MHQILLFFLFCAFSACQFSPVKEPPEQQSPLEQTESQEKQQEEQPEQPAKPPNSVDLIAKIEQCQENQTCLDELEQYLGTWFKPSVGEQQPQLLPEQIESAQLQQQQISLPLKNNGDFAQAELNNKRIQAGLNEWLTWKRPQLIETWNNYQFFKSSVFPPFRQMDIPESLLLAIIAQESGGRVHSSSSAGAGGLFQFMPATARRFGVVGTIGDYDARYSPRRAAKGAAKYIAEQRGFYGDDYAKILAAYNSGENRFKRLNKKHRNSSIWGNKFFYDLPNETQHYIGTVLSAMMIFSEPEKFNVDLTERDGKTILVKAAVDTSLSELAVCFGQYNNQVGWYRVLRNLNFSTNAKRVVKKGSTLVIPEELEPIYLQNCQGGDLMKLAKAIHKADFPDLPEYRYYSIKRGDSLGSISRKFKCVSRREIARLNKIKAPRYLIHAGKKLKIPKC